MKHLEGLISQIKQRYPYGALYEYLQTSSLPEPRVIIEHLELIEKGEDAHHVDEDAQVSAYIFIRKLKLADNGQPAFFSRRY